MDSCDSAATAAAVSGNSSSSPPPPPAVVVSPCAACKILRRRCAEGCVLAPYFPPSDPLKFTLAHRVFGASNIIKLLQELPESQRSDAVSSMVYEANARVRDPVYGTAGAICQLQKQVNELQAQLAKAHAEIVNLRAQQANLLTLMCVEMGQMAQSPPPSSSPSSLLSSPESGAVDVGFPSSSNSCCFMDDESLASMWELPLWT